MRGFRDEDDGEVRAASEAVADARIAVIVKRPSAKGRAILVDTGIKEVWVPCALLRDRVDRDGASIIVVPRWFAAKEGML